MPSSTNQALALARHPGTRSEAVRGIIARVAKLPGGVLALTYVIEGDLDRLRIPAPQPPAVGERLWQHSCCEVFIARKGVAAYHEFNFAPSGAWAAYAFARYRDGAPLVDASLDPRVAVRRSREKLELDAFIPLALLSPDHAEARLALALAAVIEDEAGTLSYWALRHAPGAPDFHHPHAYALELE
ncbi:MAG: DOMON-like domain-containing protein [Burkholderiales bacterium]